MLCPYCAKSNTKVIDKRDKRGVAKRRRECLKCFKRFNTQERVEKLEIRIVKKDGRREEFDAEKVKKGIKKACEKRAISTEIIEKMVGKIEGNLRRKGKEISSRTIGELVSKELKKIDNVAYIRFASVYRDFSDISDFRNEIKDLIGGRK